MGLKKTDRNHKLFDWRTMQIAYGCFNCKDADKESLGKAACCHTRKVFAPPCGDELCAGLRPIKTDKEVN